MRLSVVLGFAACFLLPVQSQAGWGIFQSYVILDSGSGDQYLAGGVNSDGASAFAGTDLGDFTAADALTLNGGELKTYKNGSSNVCGGTLNYRVYASGETPGAFTALGLPFSANLSGSDQKWAATGQAIDLLDALTAGDYVLELYWETDGNDSNPSGCGETKYDSDSGNNFTATFSVLSTGACGTSVNFDGYDYETVQIGEQCWFAENLRTTIYANGDLIPAGLTDYEWTTGFLTSGATAVYGEGSSTCENFSPDIDACDETQSLATYGRLYNWYAVGDARGLCPAGWHVPTDGEWMVLEMELGMSESEANSVGLPRGTDQAIQLKSTSGWNNNSNGTDDFGFSALPGGYRNIITGEFNSAGSLNIWWSSSFYDNSTFLRVTRSLNVDNDLSRSATGPQSGFSVRCLREVDSSEVQGCTDPEYIEYDASATTDDGSCATLVVEGCTDADYTEYDASANTDDGSCATLVVEGCTDANYTEYDASANTDDGSCATLVVEGCTDADYTEYDASANTDDGSCATLVVEGCTDANYTEYDASANTDDGSCATLLGCTNSDMASMDGYNYGLTTIGDQCWFAENLRTTLYADGSAIPELTDHAEWAATSTGARCDYDNVPFPNVATYGRLYNWHAATDASGLCPSGWHVPTDEEWTGLEDYITSQGFDGTEGTALKSTSGWSAGNGTDNFGFAALPGGRRNNGDFNSFTGIGSIGRWWSSSPDGSDAWSRNMNQNPGISRGSTDPGKGFSIRCLRNADHTESQGCTDPAYLEFDASANVDDNSCATLVVEGCTDPAYTEYDASANTDDGSCATLVVEGCTDSDYTEYDASANTDDGSCATLVVEGCTDPAYLEFDASANIDDGSCATLVVEGCTDADYTEYDASANTDDGSCATLVVEGCTDPAYLEFDASANTDDGSCATLVVEGCMDANYTEYDASANTDDGSCATLLGCTDSDVASMDGYNYGLTTIGDQCWFAEHLRTTVYADGSAIPEVTDDATWTGLSSGARCNYNNDAGNVASYGRLYNWYAVDDSRSLCPNGWHVPTDGEWTNLENNVSSLGFSGAEGTALKSTSGYNGGGNGTDDFGFSAFPGGYRRNYDGSFTGAGYNVDWWSSSLVVPDNGVPEAWSRNLYGFFATVGRDYNRLGDGFSVRCLRDANHTESQGCTDPSYLEFDASANVDDGSCSTLVVEGCTDSNFIEYDASANTDDGSCATPVVEGCTDSDYTEYDASANTDDGSCATPVVEGCTDSDYTEYDASANTDDGSCATLIVEGCTDSAFTEYDASANTDDGSCATPVVEGCTDSDYTEYDASANTDDGSCSTLVVEGCMDQAYAEYDASANTDDGSCTTLVDPCAGALVLGSIDATASSDINTADGSATLTVATGTPTSLTLTGINGTGDYTFAQPGAIDGLATGYYNVTATDANGCTSNTLQLVIPYSLCCDCGVSDQDSDGLCDDEDNCFNRNATNFADPANEACIIPGCMDPAYIQYDPTATIDNGSCTTPIVEGCTDPAADNYDASANTEDGSCIYYGCTDPAYLEYDAAANTDDGSCATVASTCAEVEMDGHTYAVVEIGDQCWFAENLRTTTYADGTVIPAGLTDGEWTTTTAGATAVYGEGSSTCENFSPDIDACNEALSLVEYGRLYNWYAVDDARGLCPAGWHVPTDEEWTNLKNYVTSQGFSGTEGTALKSTSGWYDNGNGTDDFGFSALPGGYRNGPNGLFDFTGYSGRWWSSSPEGSSAWFRSLNYYGSAIGRPFYNPRYGLSVRCVRDAD